MDHPTGKVNHLLRRGRDGFGGAGEENGEEDADYYGQKKGNGSHLERETNRKLSRPLWA